MSEVAKQFVLEKECWNNKNTQYKEEHVNLIFLYCVFLYKNMRQQVLQIFQ